MFSNNGYYGQYSNPNAKPLSQYGYDYEGGKANMQNQVIMTQPTGGPWNVQSVPWGLQSPPSLVEFTAQPEPNSPQLCAFTAKRKAEFDPPIPTKLVKTDEVMAAHLNGLHISSEFTSHSKSATNSLEDELSSIAEEDLYKTSIKNVADRLSANPSASSIQDMLKHSNKIVLCDEMRKLQNEPLLPQSLIDKLEKPCMSLVLWKPPCKSAVATNSQSNNNKHKNSESKHNKRGVLVQDLNAMDTF